MKNKIIVRDATEEDFLKIFKFNYEIFTNEIGQYSKNNTGLKVDKFHYKNHYFIALDGLDIVGLLAVHCESPYSAEEKFVDFYKTIKEGTKIVEIRLFALSKEHRGTLLAWKLLSQMIKYLLKKEIDCIVISAIESQVKLYKKLGFSIFGEYVQVGRAKFYPMRVNFNDIIKNRFISNIAREKQ